VGNLRTEIQWLKRGRQKRVIVPVLRKPMTATEIVGAARQINPHLQLRDLWFLMPQLLQRNLVTCLNPNDLNGKLYTLTDFGRYIAEMAFGVQVEGTPPDIDWRKYSWVARGRIRRLVLLEVGCQRLGEEKAKTVSRIRRRLSCPVSFNSTRRALAELRRARLLRCVALTKTGRQKLYRVSLEGRRIIDQLLK
jgi:hypothetical protein